MTNWGWRLDSGSGKALLGEEEEKGRSKVFLFTLSDWEPQVFAREAHSLVSGKLSRGPPVDYLLLHRQNSCLWTPEWPYHQNSLLFMSVEVPVKLWEEQHLGRWSGPTACAKQGGMHHSKQTAAVPSTRDRYHNSDTIALYGIKGNTWYLRDFPLQYIHSSKPTSLLLTIQYDQHLYRSKYWKHTGVKAPLAALWH